MKKNGFTLIELLAVIVIISILFTILVPKVFTFIGVSRQKAFANSAGVLIDAAHKYMASPERELPIPSEMTEPTLINSDFLAQKGYLKNSNNIAGSVVVLYRHSSGELIYYVYATDGNYYIDGCRKSVTIDDCNCYAKKVVKPIDYAALIPTQTLYGGGLCMDRY
mgnify:CR=1 FL=1